MQQHAGKPAHHAAPCRAPPAHGAPHSSVSVAANPQCRQTHGSEGQALQEKTSPADTTTAITTQEFQSAAFERSTLNCKGEAGSSCSSQRSSDSSTQPHGQQWLLAVMAARPHVDSRLPSSAQPKPQKNHLPKALQEDGLRTAVVGAAQGEQHVCTPALGMQSHRPRFVPRAKPTRTRPAAMQALSPAGLCCGSSCRPARGSAPSCSTAGHQHSVSPQKLTAHTATALLQLKGSRSPAVAHPPCPH